MFAQSCSDYALELIKKKQVQKCFLYFCSEWATKTLKNLSSFIVSPIHSTLSLLILHLDKKNWENFWMSGAVLTPPLQSNTFQFIIYCCFASAKFSSPLDLSFFSCLPGLCLCHWCAHLFPPYSPSLGIFFTAAHIFRRVGGKRGFN